MTPGRLPVGPVAGLRRMRGLEQRMLAQRLSALAHEALEVGGEGRSRSKIASDKVVEQTAQPGKLRSARHRPVDQRRRLVCYGRLGSKALRAEDDGRVAVQWV